MRENVVKDRVAMGSLGRPQAKEIKQEWLLNVERGSQLDTGRLRGGNGGDEHTPTYNANSMVLLSFRVLCFGCPPL